MYSRFKNFIYRHRRKFIISSVVIGGAVLAVRYTQKKLQEWQEKEVKEFLEKSKKEHHFRSTERTCNQTITSLAETLKEAVLKLVETDDVLARIRKADANKVVLWDELKILVFTQLSSLLYSGLLLVVLLRIQLNVMSGYMFREKIDEEADKALSLSFQQHYLSLCEHFLTTGIKDLCSLMEKHVRLVLTDISLKRRMTLQDVEQIFWAIQASISSDELDPLKSPSKYLVPPNNSLNFNGKNAELMKKIVGETYELLDCEEVVSIVNSCIKRGFSNSVDLIACYYVPEKNNFQNKTEPEVFSKEDSAAIAPVNITKVTVPMAKLVPIIHGLVKMPSTNGKVDPWIQQFLIMDKINMLGANLYEAFSVHQEDI